MDDEKKQAILSASKDLCELMMKQINDDDRLESNLDVLEAIRVAASFFADQCFGGQYHFTLAPVQVAPLLMHLVLGRMVAGAAKAEEEAAEAIKKAMEK